MIKQYEITVHVEGHYIVEDPKCPSYWRGSGCYDIKVDTWCDQVLEVWARSVEEARGFVEEYDYAEGYTIEIDAVWIRDVKFIAEIDRDEEEVGVIEQVINWKNYE